MPETLSYASVGLPRGFSRSALVALGLAIAGPLVYWASAAIAAAYAPTNEATIVVLLAEFLIPPLLAFVLGLGSLVRMTYSDNPRRGIWVALIAMAASVAWPVYGIYWAIQHWPNC